MSGLHFTKQRSGEKIDRKLFECVSEVYNLFSYVCMNRFRRNCFRYKKIKKILLLPRIGWLSDHHHLIYSVMKTTFKCEKPKKLIYRNYENFSQKDFKIFQFVVLIDKHAPPTKYLEGIINSTLIEPRKKLSLNAVNSKINQIKRKTLKIF